MKIFTRARGDHRENSDWDILVLVNNETLTNEIEDSYRTGFYDIELETGNILSSFFYSKNTWEQKMYVTPLYKNIEKEAIQIC